MHSLIVLKELSEDRSIFSRTQKNILRNNKDQTMVYCKPINPISQNKYF
jgi:hypothetical protein